MFLQNEITCPASSNKANHAKWSSQLGRYFIIRKAVKNYNEKGSITASARAQLVLKIIGLF